jgi:DNA sulfur modification protein DndD
LRQDFASSKKALDEVNRNLDRLAPQLQGVKGNEEHIKDVAKRLRAAENAHTEAVRQLENLRIQTLQAATTVTDCKRKFDKATANTEEATELKEKIDFLSKALGQANTFNSEILEGVRIRLEEFVSRYFSKIKGGSLKTRISEDFEVETLTPDGIPAKLSEGEKMLKAYIFSIALREVVGLSFPLIVDTPFGRLDEVNRGIVSETLRELLGQESRHQVVFMMHDGEYTPYTKRDFDPVRPFESFLDWDGDSGVSSLSLGIDPDWLKRTAWRDWSRGVLSE